MSVPLDRLYHYLADIVNHDLVIYRWAPHGSKKLEDLIPLITRSDSQDLTVPIVIYHDQEPLHFEQYSQQEFRIAAQKIFTKYNIVELNKDQLLDYYSSLNLRSIAVPNNQFDTTILVHSELQSVEVKKYQQANFVPVYYWSHGLLSQDWFRYAEHDPKLKFNVDLLQKDFLVYNRAWGGTREYRLYFAELLVKNNLIDCSNVTFSRVDNNTDYCQHQFVNKNLQISEDELHKYFKPNTADSASSADYNNEDYFRAGIEIVLETLFDDIRWHLTEKSLRPIACGKPFMLAATAGSLQYLRSYGFKTFSGLIDESYDLIVEPHLRLQAIAQEMQRISQLSPNKKYKLYTDLNCICQYNKQHFFNSFAGQVITEYKNNLDQAMSIMHQNCTSKHMAETKRLLKNN